jgi:metacaspase-1
MMFSSGSMFPWAIRRQTGRKPATLLRSPRVVATATAKPATAKKVALLIGINYASDPANRLHGCVNDVRDMGRILRDKFAFDEVAVCDDEATPDKTTLRGIAEAIQTLAERSVSEKLGTVWIHFSGHGVQVRDTSGDEADSKDECICPSDFATCGVLRDDELNVLLSRFDPGTRIVLVFDCCHSGTAADLKYHWTSRTQVRMETLAKLACRSPAVMLSGARDFETASDASFFDPATNLHRPQGALTWALMQTLNSPRWTNNAFDVLQSIRDHLKKGNFVQVAQLTSSHDLRTDPRFMG